MTKHTQTMIKFWLVIFVSLVIGFVIQMMLSESQTSFSNKYLWMTLFTPLIASLLWFFNSIFVKHKQKSGLGPLSVGLFLFFLTIASSLPDIGNSTTGYRAIGSGIQVIALGLPLGVFYSFLIKKVSED